MLLDRSEDIFQSNVSKWTAKSIAKFNNYYQQLSQQPPTGTT